MQDVVRGGTRGGAAEFKWSDVKADKDRENYLGHSINAPQGRWQNHKDIHWYNRNKSDVTDEEALRREKAREIREIKMREENELSIALGYGPVHDLERLGMDEEAGGEVKAEGSVVKTERELELEKLEAEEKRRRKELKREKKAMKETEKKIRKQEKEERRAHRSRDHRDRSRDRSRERRDRSRDRSREKRDRTRSPEQGRRRIDDAPYEPSRRNHHEPTSRHHPAETPRRHSPDRTRGVPDRRSSPARQSSFSRNTERKGAEYDLEAERVRDRQRWEREHDRERGLRDGDGWGRR